MSITNRNGAAITVSTTDQGCVVLLTAPPSDDGNDLTIEFVALGNDQIWHELSADEREQMTVVSDAMSDALNAAFDALSLVEDTYIQMSGGE